MTTCCSIASFPHQFFDLHNFIIIIIWRWAHILTSFSYSSFCSSYSSSSSIVHLQHFFLSAQLRIRFEQLEHNSSWKFLRDNIINLFLPLFSFVSLQNTLLCSRCPRSLRPPACVRPPEASTRHRPGERWATWSGWREQIRWRWSLRCATSRSLWRSRQLRCNNSTRSKWSCSTRATSCPQHAAPKCTSRGMGRTLRMCISKRCVVASWQTGCACEYEQILNNPRL